MKTANLPEQLRRVEAEYKRLAPEYDSRWSYYILATRSATAKRLDMQEPATVLDVGCGTGGFLDTLAQRWPSARLCGLDVSRSMIELARERFQPRTLLVEGSAEAIPFEESSFDLVVSLSVLHYWLQPVACLREMHRVLRPGGRLLITDWCDDYVSCRICDWYLRRFSRAYVKSFTLGECKRLLRDSGFSNVEGDRYRISWLWGLMTVRGQKP